MAKVCDICQKGKLSGHNVSHSNRKSNRFWQPNLKKVKAIIDGSHKTIKVCTKCIRSGKVRRAL
ncbi:MAG: 50S ribosomal protein L28 [Clostridiales bacterium]|nr:50S ribosomal protein L28 [Clostridiales bacterium]